MPTLNKTIARLKHLYSTCLHAQQNCLALAVAAQAAPLRRFLSERAQEQGALLDCLQQQISAYGGLPARGRGLVGWWRRCRHALRASGHDRGRLASALACETDLEHDFEKLLGQTLSPDFRAQLAGHHDCAQTRIRQLRAARAHWPQLDALDPIADLHA